MGKASNAKRPAREERREQVSRLCRDKARRSRPRRQAQLEPLLGYLEREFPASLRDLPYARDLDEALGDTVVELLGNLLQVEDLRALALSEVFLAAYPDLPGSYYRAGAVLRRVLTDWPDFPAAVLERGTGFGGTGLSRAANPRFGPEPGSPLRWGRSPAVPS